MSENKKIVKGILLGDTAVGKTSFISACMELEIKSESTTNASYTNFDMQDDNSNEYTFEVWDTAGQEQYADMTRQYYKGTDVVFLLTSCEKDKALEKKHDGRIKDFIDSLSEKTGLVNIEFIFVLNKIDLAENEDARREEFEEVIRDALPNYEGSLDVKLISCTQRSNIDETLKHGFELGLSMRKAKIQQGDNDDNNDSIVKLDDNHVTKEDKKNCC